MTEKKKKTAAAKTAKPKAPAANHGGTRENSGRPAFFRGKDFATSVRLTKLGKDKADANTDRLSREAAKTNEVFTLTDFFETLARKFGDKLTMADVRAAGKLG